MNDRQLTRRGFLGLTAMTGAAALLPAPAANAMTMVFKPVREHAASVMSNAGSISRSNGRMSASQAPDRKHAGQIGKPRRKRPCASLPGQGCR